MGSGDGVTWTDLRSILKAEPIGLDGLKGKRLEEKEEWRMPSSFAEKSEQPKGSSCLLRWGSLCGKHLQDALRLSCLVRRSHGNVRWAVVWAGPEFRTKTHM